MRISTLELKSFKSYLNVSLPLDAPRIFVAGLNEVGKSAIRESIKYVLSGRCQGLDGKGAGSELLVPSLNGSSGVSVAAAIDGLGVVERTWSPAGTSFRVQGWTGDKQSQQTALYDKLQTTDAFLQAVLDSATFLNLHHADAKALVLSLLNVRIKLGDAEDSPVMTLAELDDAYDQAFEDRKTAKLRLKACFVPLKPADVAHPKVEDVDALLKKRREELATLNQQLGATVGRRAELNNRVSTLTYQIEHAQVGQDLSAQIENLEERLAIMEADVAPAEPEAPARPTGKIDTIPVETLRKRIDLLKGFQPVKGCIIDGKVGCNTHKLKFTNRAKDLEVEIEARESGRQEQVPARKVQPIAPVNPLTEQRKALEDLKRRQTTYEQAVQTTKDRQSELEKVQADLAALPDTSAVEAQVADWQAKIAKGEQIRKDAKAYQDASQAYEAGLTAQREAKAEVDRLEQLVAVMGPSGVRVQALGSALETFEAAVNTFTGAYGLTVRFQLDPWDVLVNDRAVRTYSASQQYRIGIAIQLAVAGLSGLRFAVVDGLDILDQRKRDVMARMLFREAPVDQLIILATREPDQKLPVLPGLVAYRLDLQEGRSVVVERSAA